MRTLLAALVAVFATDASAAVLYKLVDPLGRTTFADSVPQGFAGSVTRLDIETGSNLISPAQTSNPLARYDVVAPRAVLADEERLRLSAQRLEGARLALADAQTNSLAEDWIYFGPNNPQGMRRAPRPEYQARLDQLANNLVVAEAEYEALRREFR